MNIYTRPDVLEICTDASIKELIGKDRRSRTFGSAGAVCINTGETLINICPDSTNNRAELIAIYTGVLLADREFAKGQYKEIKIYSDSQFSIFGLTKWMDSWLANQRNGILYNSTGKPVANQELFMMIITYCVVHKLVVFFKHQKGHVNLNSYSNLNKASGVYYKSNNREVISQDDIYKISYYNDYIDNATRNKLDEVNPDLYPVLQFSDNERRVMCRYAVPDNYKSYVRSY